MYILFPGLFENFWLRLMMVRLVLLLVLEGSFIWMHGDLGGNQIEEIAWRRRCVVWWSSLVVTRWRLLHLWWVGGVSLWGTALLVVEILLVRVVLMGICWLLIWLEMNIVTRVWGGINCHFLGGSWIVTYLVGVVCRWERLTSFEDFWWWLREVDFGIVGARIGSRGGGVFIWNGGCGGRCFKMFLKVLDCSLVPN